MSQQTLVSHTAPNTTATGFPARPRGYNALLREGPEEHGDVKPRTPKPLSDMYIEADPTNGDSHIAFRGARYLPQPPPNSEILDALKELGAFASIRLFSLLFFRFSACLVGWLLLDNARITAPPHGSEPTVPDSESAFKAFRTGAPVVALAIAFAAGAMALKSDVSRSKVRVRAAPRWDLEMGRGRGRGLDRGQAAMAAMMASGPALST